MAIEVSKRCTSVHSYKRLATALQSAIVAQLDNASDDDDDDDANLQALCQALCRTLSLSANTSLLDECVAALRNQFSIAPNDGSIPRKDTSAKQEHATAFRNASRRKMGALHKTFATVAQKCNAASYPALSLASSVAAHDGAGSARLMELFLAAALSGSAFPTPSQVRMAHVFAASAVTQSSFEEQLAPALGLKLRAHPDKVLPLAEALFASLGASGAVDAASQLEGDAGANLLPSVMKHLRSTKVGMRACARRTLVAAAQL